MSLPVQILSAPSILGLQPGGVERLGERLLATGLTDKLKTSLPVLRIPVQNDRYNPERDPETACLNPQAIRDFSSVLGAAVSSHLNQAFQLVLGGDCSILLGIMPALKAKGTFGLIFVDAHADFYEPERSTTGEVADMDLAIVTGRGPDILTNIGGMKPYMNDENVIHVAQRDAEEADRYGSQDIKKSGIRCLDLEGIRQQGMKKAADEIVNWLERSIRLDGYWIHFDTDVLDDDENPAVDYRLPGGLSFAETRYLLGRLVATGRITGMSVTIFNPDLDPTGEIAEKIADCMAGALKRRP